MRQRDDLSPDLAVYRRVPGDQWDHATGRPKAGAFIDRHQRLSVYLADVQTPRSVLQIRIDTWSEESLASHGRSVEALVAEPNPWRVVRAPLGLFTAVGRLSIEPEVIPDDGHIELCGDVRLYVQRLIRGSEVLTAEECLAVIPEPACFSANRDRGQSLRPRRRPPSG